MNLTGRYFEFWEFRVSHTQLLIRSPRTKDQPRNIDVIFSGVAYVNLPTKLGPIEIASATADDLSRARSDFRDDVVAGDVHVFVSGNKRWVIVAAAMRTNENDLDLFESSLESF